MDYKLSIETTDPTAVVTAVAAEAKRWAIGIRSRKHTTNSVRRKAELETAASEMEKFASHISRIVIVTTEAVAETDNI